MPAYRAPGCPILPVKALGLRRMMFAVEDLEGILAHMQGHGAQLMGEMTYGTSHRLAYLQGPEGLIVDLTEALR